MDRAFNLSRLLSLKAPMITDGAWGTELQKRGLALGEPADLWNLTHPADVEAVALAYVRAGSQIILTNTFRANPVSLAGVGVDDKAALINRGGVRLSRSAAGLEVLVFASMGPLGKSLAKQEIDARTVTDAFKLQAEALAEGGADALLFETFSDVDEARLAVRGQADRTTDRCLVRVLHWCEPGPDDDGRRSRNGGPRHGRGRCRRRGRELRRRP